MPGPPVPVEGRPTVIASLIASVNGQVTEGGRVAHLTGLPDQRLLHRLRAAHDAVLVGATTVRIEGYDSLLDQPERERRAKEGRPEQPALCIVTSRAGLDLDLPAFQSRDLTKIILTSTKADLKRLPSELDVLRSETNQAGELDLGSLLSSLYSERGVRHLLCEGGPTLIGALVRDGLLDELFLSLSPRIAGGDGLRPIGNVGANPRELSLLAHAAEDGYLFTRYRLKR
jgi:riboflavin biosynthesis pyrimidine reductase